MRWISGSLQLTTAVAVVGLLALNWRAQVQTQQKFDTLTATLAARPAEPTSAPAPVPTPVVAVPETGAIPRELTKISVPPYIIEAPDQLSIEVVVKDPKTGGTDRLPTQPIAGAFQVRMDGTVGLGYWGSVFVSGMTLEQASTAVRGQVAKMSEKVPADRLVVVVDVLAYNSKRYYVITDSGSGEQVYPFPITGSETVLDAISNVNGLSDVAGKRKVWIARPSSRQGQPHQILSVDWTGITQHGVTYTNYQVMPGDRVYVARAGD